MFEQKHRWPEIFFFFCKKKGRRRKLFLKQRLSAKGAKVSINQNSILLNKKKSFEQIHFSAVKLHQAAKYCLLGGRGYRVQEGVVGRAAHYKQLLVS